MTGKPERGMTATLLLFLGTTLGVMGLANLGLIATAVILARKKHRSLKGRQAT